VSAAAPVLNIGGNGFYDRVLNTLREVASEIVALGPTEGVSAVVFLESCRLIQAESRAAAARLRGIRLSETVRVAVGSPTNVVIMSSAEALAAVEAEIQSTERFLNDLADVMSAVVGATSTIPGLHLRSEGLVS
jgi:hypothetical protein